MSSLRRVLRFVFARRLEPGTSPEIVRALLDTGRTAIVEARNLAGDGDLDVLMAFQRALGAIGDVEAMLTPPPRRGTSSRT